MSKRIPAVAFSLLSVALLLAGEVRAQQEPVNLALQINRYYGGQDRALVEGAVDIAYAALQFDEADQGLKADARVEVMIQRADGQEVYRTEHRIEPEAVNPDMALSSRVSSIETFAIYAPPGEYTARVIVTDLRANRSFEVTRSMLIPTERPFFSDILLTSHVQKDVRLSEGTYLPYLIGTTMFSPNPRGAFFKDAPLVYFYYEINPEGQPDETEIAMTIRDASGAVIKDLGERRIEVRAEQNFDLGAFNIGGLAPGSYVLRLECESCSTRVTEEQAFEVHAAQGAPAFVGLGVEESAAPVELAYYSDLTPAQVDSVISVMDILFSQEQKNLLATLTPEGKVRFLNRFWDSADNEPETPDNEFKILYEQRVAYADQFFTSSQRPGYQTDRGRIHLRFGAPSEVVDRPVEATIGPYVIWNYNSLGKTFAFGDFRKDGDYRLIYSTDPQFTGDPTIQAQVNRDPGSARESFLPIGRGYELVIEDIKAYRVTTGFQN